MRVRGLVHIHSTISFDGRLTLDQIRDLARAHGFGFVLMTEHIEHLEEADLERLIEACRRGSSADCLLIPGLEIEAHCQYYLGMTRPVPTGDAREARRQLLEAGAVAVLAHPHRMKRPLTSEERSEIRAIEIWNVKDDGSRAPGYVGYRIWQRWRAESPGAPAPIAGVDLHGIDGFRPIGIEVEVDRLEAGAILDAVRAGQFVIWNRSRIFDPESVRMSDLWLGRLIWDLRRVYRTLQIRRILPTVLRQTLKRLFKG